MQDVLNQFKQLKKEIENIKTEINNQKNQLLNYKKVLLADIKSVKEGIKIDENNIKSKYFMLKNGEYIRFLQAVLKPQISKYLVLADNVYKKIKPYLPKNEQKSKRPVIPRKGILIRYTDKIHYPDFVLEKGIASLKTSVAEYKINASNLSDNQHLLKKPAIIIVKADGKFYQAFLKVGYYDFVKFSGYANNIKLKKLKLNKLQLINPVINANFEGMFKNNINALIKAKIKTSKIIMLGNDKTQKIINSVLKSIHAFDLYIQIKGNLKRPEIFIKSDLDKLITKALKNTLSQKYKKELVKVQSMLNQKINTQLRQYDISAVDIDLTKLNDRQKTLDSLKKAVERELRKKAKSSIIKSIGKFF